MATPPLVLSIKFDASSGLRCDQFLFMSGDRAKWLVASNASVAGAPYGTAPRPVARSSVDRFPHAVEWEHRAGAAEGPWISLTDHAVAVSQGDVIYAEAAWPGVGVGGTKLLQEHNGANVFCRVMGMPRDALEGGGGYPPPPPGRPAYAQPLPP